MARPQVTDGGTASNMEGSCEYSEPTRGSPPAWGLGEVLTTPHRKNVYCYDIFIQNAAGVGVWSGLSWLRIGTGGRHL